MSVSRHPIGWWNWCLRKVRKKGIEPIFTGKIGRCEKLVEGIIQNPLYNSEHFMSFTDFSCVIFGPKCKTCEHPQIYIGERLFIEIASEKGKYRNIMENLVFSFCPVIT